MSQEMVQEVEQATVVDMQPYPVRFLSILEEDGFTMLDKWLEEHKAPQEVKELAIGLSALSAAIEQQLKSPSADLFELSSEGILQVTRGIDALGGSFHGMNSIA